MKLNPISLVRLLISVSVFEKCQPLMTPDSIPMNYAFVQILSTNIIQSTPSSTSTSAIDGGSLLVSLNNANARVANYQKDGFQKDTVMRILDGNTIKLQKGGLVSIAGARFPIASSSNFQFSECYTYGPTYKLRQLVPAKTEVWVKTSGSKPQAIIFRQKDSLNVNQELVKSGFAKVKPISSEFEAYLDPLKLKSWEAEANRLGLGIFKQCDASVESSFVAEFEPLEYDVVTQWGNDGGKQIVKQKESTAIVPPRNPGDVRGCSDFETYEDALSWFEYYKPFYGDIGKLDRNGDGVPCPGLPHTSIREKYRMKKPLNQDPSTLTGRETR
ncbi:unnamed protein product [Cylindrotheca closterium]|uniref:TNase-like domain-containing protein n=1 Tax=Cylindrotheca closterium TaxID=2856 RepID=A0AAD2JI57_9STRA|nr:unnamed protein product [Cylindrotheca closterium]